MPSLSSVAALLAEPTRARLLDELLGGVPLPAGALAARAGVAPSTVSGHLAKLSAAGLVVIEPVGRRREVRLAGPEVAEALEALGRLASPAPRVVGLRAVDRQTALRRARSCYDHLAGTLAIELLDGLVAREAVERRDGTLVLGAAAAPVFGALGVDVAAAGSGPRPLVRACADWTEREPHLAGALGAAVLEALLERAWVVRRGDGRALRVTAAGEAGLAALARR